MQYRAPAPGWLCQLIARDVSTALARVGSIGLAKPWSDFIHRRVGAGVGVRTRSARKLRALLVLGVFAASGCMQTHEPDEFTAAGTFAQRAPALNDAGSARPPSRVTPSATAPIGTPRPAPARPAGSSAPPRVSTTPVRVEPAAGSGGIAGPRFGGAAGRPSTGVGTGIAGTPAGTVPGDVPFDVCTADAAKASHGTIDGACLECACKSGARSVEACSMADGCWDLIACVDSMCGGLGSPDLTVCAVSHCARFLQGGGVSAVNAAFTVLTDSCSEPCVRVVDQGADAGA